MSRAQRIEHCRACGFAGLTEVLHLGHLALPGTFPKPGAPVEREPLTLGICGRCNLLQLEHLYDDRVFFERDYGYRSGLNSVMKAHLESLVQDLVERFPLRAGDTVIDIGANDGTLLRALPLNTRQIAIDPGMARYAPYYDGHKPKYLALATGYFPEVSIPCLPGQARLITSIAMFYDVRNPLDFMRVIRDLLSLDGIWYCEQHYAGNLIENLAYDSICHEHACYYGLRQLVMLGESAGLKIIDVSFNPSNGGSIGVVFSRSDSKYEPYQALPMLLHREAKILSPEAIASFSSRVLKHIRELHDFIEKLVSVDRKTVYALGASTMGNIILQLSLLGFYVAGIGEINPDKFGCVTPGTSIPIVPESYVLEHANAGYLLILPYHFRDGFIERTAEYVKYGGKLIFPLPTLEVYP